MFQSQVEDQRKACVWGWRWRHCSWSCQGLLFSRWRTLIVGVFYKLRSFLTHVGSRWAHRHIWTRRGNRCKFVDWYKTRRVTLGTGVERNAPNVGFEQSATSSYFANWRTVENGLVASSQFLPFFFIVSVFVTSHLSRAGDAANWIARDVMTPLHSSY